MRFRWLLIALASALLLLSLHLVALEQYLYWYYSWFDILMHFLGGVTIGLFLVGLCFHFRPRVFLLGATVAFLVWELFEYLMGIPREANYVFDTWLDLLMDTLGALCVYIVARLSSWRIK